MHQDLSNAGFVCILLQIVLNKIMRVSGFAYRLQRYCLRAFDAQVPAQEIFKYILGQRNELMYSASQLLVDIKKIVTGVQLLPLSRGELR